MKEISAFVILLMTVFQGCNDSLETERSFSDPVIGEASSFNDLSELNIFEPKTMSGFNAVLDQAKVDGKLVLIDLRSYTSDNCRKMERAVWQDPTIHSILEENFLIASLYVDSRDVLGDSTVGDLWWSYQITTYNEIAQPLYAVVNSENIMQTSNTANYQTHREPEKFREWLQSGLINFNKQ